MKLLAAFTVTCVAVYFLAFNEPEFSGIDQNLPIVGDAPVQNNVSGKPFKFKGYQIKPLANFSIKALVLKSKEYSNDKEAELSPVDLALGWGPMSKPSVLNEIKVSQSNRWYSWRTSRFPIPRKDIEQNSANMHIIPATKSVEETLLSVKDKQIVEIQGYLVECTQSGWKWKSSLTRNDTGNGACEVVFVKKLRVSSP